MICSIVKQGGIHTFEGTPCQDNVYAMRAGSTQAVTLCDGAGSLDGALAASSVFSKAFCEWALTHSDALFTLPEARIRLLAADLIETTLDRLCSEQSGDRQSFGCTVLLCLSNLRSGNAFVLQLGDGLVVEVLPRGKARPLSVPSIGTEHRSTFLTTCSRETILNRMQVFRRRGGASYFLMSDGAEGAFYRMENSSPVLTDVFGCMLTECLFRPSSFLRDMDHLLKNHIHPTDDFSLALLCSDAPSPDAFSPLCKRLSGKYSRYLAARRLGKSVGSAARSAGWHKREILKRRDWLMRHSIEEVFVPAP